MKVEIFLGMDPRDTKISIDGVIQKNVRSLKIKASVDEIPTLTLDIIPDEIQITGDMRVLKDSIVDKAKDCIELCGHSINVGCILNGCKREIKS